MTNIEPIQNKQPEYLYECNCGHEFLLRADALEVCTLCKSRSVAPSERSE